MSKRVEKVAEAIRREVSMMLQEREIKDPRIGFVTVVNVEVSRDLRRAKVYVTSYGGEAEKEKSLKGLNNASPFVGREIGRRLRLKFVPDITFLYDDKLQEALNVLRIIDSLHTDEK